MLDKQNGMLKSWICVFIVCSLANRALSMQCYSCVYIAGNYDSQSACSDPWPWYREAFGQLSKPPVRECPGACIKIIVTNSEGIKMVVRSCGSQCARVASNTTTTSCCQSDNLCNEAPHIHVTGRPMLQYFVILWTLLYLLLR